MQPVTCKPNITFPLQVVFDWCFITATKSKLGQLWAKHTLEYIYPLSFRSTGLKSSKHTQEYTILIEHVQEYITLTYCPIWIYTGFLKMIPTSFVQRMYVLVIIPMISWPAMDNKIFSTHISCYCLLRTEHATPGSSLNQSQPYKPDSGNWGLTCHLQTHECLSHLQLVEKEWGKPIK